MFLRAATTLLLGGVVLLTACGQFGFSCQPEQESPQALAKKSSRPYPVLLVGADGLDLKVLARLIKRKQLPVFEELISAGASGVLLSEREIRSPAIWTTIATGRPRSIHGIYDFVTGSRLWPRALRSDKRLLVTSKMRKVPAIWNYASEAGRSVAVLGWLNTWPAEEVEGVMVSPYVALGSRKQITIKGNVYPDQDQQVYPESKWPELRQLITTTDDISDELFLEIANEPSPELLRAYPILKRYMEGIRWSLAHTMTMKAMTLQLLEGDSADLTTVYFEGADSLGHRFWLFRRSIAAIEQQLAEVGLPTTYAKELKDLYGQVIDNYYVLLDRCIGELLDATPAHTRLIVVSDHGFGSRSGFYAANPNVPFNGEHRLEGSIIAAGHGVVSGTRIYGATIYDIAPTLFELMGMRAPEKFEGSSLVSQIFEASTLLDTQVQPAGDGDDDDDDDDDDEDDDMPSVNSTDDDGTAEPETIREQELERLRSLGYIQ